MKSVLALILFAISRAAAVAGSTDLVLDVNLFQGYRSSAPAPDPLAAPIVVLAPERGWSAEIEKQRQQIAETLGLDGATLIARVEAILPSGAARSIEFPREGAAPLIVEVRPTRSGASRVNLDIRLREKTAPEADVASVSVSGEMGKTFIVGGKPQTGPFLVSVTPRESEKGIDAGGRDREVHTIGGDVKPPTIVRKIEPAFPEKLRAEKKSGIVAMQATIDAQGRVVNLAIVRHSDPEFDSAALEAVRQWEYSPATREGKPVAVYLTITIAFRTR